MSYPATAPFVWKPALRYYGALASGLGLLRAAAWWWRWPALPAWAQAALVLSLLAVSFWPIIRLSRVGN